MNSKVYSLRPRKSIPLLALRSKKNIQGKVQAKDCIINGRVLRSFKLSSRSLMRRNCKFESVRSKTKGKSVKKAQSKILQVKKTVKKLVTASYRKRQIKICSKKQSRRKGLNRKSNRSNQNAMKSPKLGQTKAMTNANIKSIDAKNYKNKGTQTLKPSTVNERSQKSPIAANTDTRKKHQLRCAVCLDEYTYPVKLPCSHTFCFLCAKGFILRNGRCALCRQIVSLAFLKSPVMVNKSEVFKESNDFKWFYEGSNNGWWQYDDHSNDVIEEAFQNGSEKCDVMIAGFMYEINLKEKFQRRKFEASIVRCIKRARGTIKKRGIAGIPVKPSAKKMPFMLSRLQ